MEGRTRRQEENAISGATEVDITKKLPQYRSYAEEQVIRKRNAKEELDRVRKQVEYDKQARREWNEYSKSTVANPDHHQGIEVKPLSSQQTARNISGSTRLQVRLLDGSAIRSTFDSSTPFSKVRQWLDSSRTDGDHPYSLKQLMTPAPSPLINDEDHSRSLNDLGLHPSATLVMAPVQGLAAAYQQSPSGAAHTIAGLIWTYVVAMVLRVISKLKTFLGLGERPQQGQAEQGTVRDETRRVVNLEATATGATPASGDSGIRIRSLKDQRRETNDRDGDSKRSEHQLYNGGGVSQIDPKHLLFATPLTSDDQLNFEPRRIDEGDSVPKTD